MGVRLLDVLLYRSLLPVRESRREPLPVLELATEKRKRVKSCDVSELPETTGEPVQQHHEHPSLHQAVVFLRVLHVPQ